jgi:ribose 5-phosphate isomerase B
MKVYLGADHRGFPLKEEIKSWLEKWDYPHEDMGAYELDESDDYTLYAEKVATIVSHERGAKGILVCGSGVGVDVVSNKFDGVRASIGKEPDQVKAGRNDDDMNVLVIAGDYTTEEDAKEMVKVFLETEFDGLVRHERRLEEIKRIEENN